MCGKRRTNKGREEKCVFNCDVDLRGGNLRPGGHRRPVELLDRARRASQSFLQKPDEEGC